MRSMFGKRFTVAALLFSIWALPVAAVHWRFPTILYSPLILLDRMQFDRVPAGKRLAIMRLTQGGTPARSTPPAMPLPSVRDKGHCT